MVQKDSSQNQKRKPGAVWMNVLKGQTSQEKKVWEERC